MNETVTVYYFNGKAYAVAVDIIAAIGIIGNLLLFLLMFNKKLRCYSFSIFLRYLAVFDTIVLVANSTEDTIEKFYSGKLMMQTLYTPSASCYIWSSIHTLSRVASPWLLVGLSMDRLQAVVHPSKWPTTTSRKKAHLFCIGVILAAIIVYFTFVICDQETSCYIDCSFCDSYVKHYIAAMIAGTLIHTQIPVIIILGLNAYTARTLYLISNRKKSNESTKMTASLVLVAFVSFVALFPKAIVEIVEMIQQECCDKEMSGSSRHSLFIAWHVAHALMLLNFSMNFYVLLLFSRQFRQIVCPIFRWKNHHEVMENEGVPLTDVDEDNMNMKYK